MSGSPVTIVRVTGDEVAEVLSSSMVQAYKPEAVILDERSAFLDGSAANQYSQFGEDVLIDELFDVIGTTNRWCFEVGASDGRKYSNTKVLREQGWSAVLMEGDGKHLGALNYAADTEDGTCAHWVEIDIDTTIDDVLARDHAPYDMDLGVIDIDGQDYWAWSDMRLYHPRVMLVEYRLRSPEASIPQRYDGGDMNYGQAGRDAIVELGREKGYRALAATPCNVLFAKEELCR